MSDWDDLYATLPTVDPRGYEYVSRDMTIKQVRQCVRTMPPQKPSIVWTKYDDDGNVEDEGRYTPAEHEVNLVAYKAQRTAWDACGGVFYTAGQTRTEAVCKTEFGYVDTYVHVGAGAWRCISRLHRPQL